MVKETLITQLVYNGRWGLPMRKISDDLWRPVKTSQLRKREHNGYLFGIQTVQRIIDKMNKDGKSTWKTNLKMINIYRGVMLFELTCRKG